MSNVFGWDYPAGAEHDPRAPWNEKEERDEEDDEGPSKEELAMEKADMAMDLAKDDDAMYEPRDRIE
tara:strand:+ start:8419 stop:8619 length:201 start_codon:yes stop_codon:yes gene_type:complete